MNRLAQPGQEREGHVGLVYPTAAVRDERLAAFVGTGLQRGEQVVLMAQPDDHTRQAPLARMRPCRVPSGCVRRQPADLPGHRGEPDGVAAPLPAKVGRCGVVTHEVRASGCRRADGAGRRRRPLPVSAGSRSGGGDGSWCTPGEGHL